MTKITKSETINTVISSSYDGQEHDLDTFIDDLIRYRAAIPAPYKGYILVDISGGYDNSSSYVSLTVRYDRPETDEEQAARIEPEKNNQRATEEQELTQLAYLKAKYETN